MALADVVYPVQIATGFWAGFFDRETREFTYSCLRELYKGLLVVFCIIAFRFAIVAMAMANIAAWTVTVLESADDCWAIATVAIVAFRFLGKLWSNKRRSQ
jgi:hypothetical protein